MTVDLKCYLRTKNVSTPYAVLRNIADNLLLNRITSLRLSVGKIKTEALQKDSLLTWRIAILSWYFFLRIVLETYGQLGRNIVPARKMFLNLMGNIFASRAANSASFRCVGKHLRKHNFSATMFPRSPSVINVLFICHVCVVSCKMLISMRVSTK
jgi:hypothetical protein